jgi:pyruvate/2-oxoglutarate dehydrogenase complex dihydrolipoamide dehydrogenase (E3) component
MSKYLVERIESLPNVEVVIGCEISSLDGKPGELEAITVRERSSGNELRFPARFLFSFIGAEPNTDWLQSSGIKLDNRGFVLTGQALGDDRFPLETSRRGIFAIGDVRSGSVKRVAASVGDGAQVVAAIHGYLADAGNPATIRFLSWRNRPLDSCRGRARDSDPLMESHANLALLALGSSLVSLSPPATAIHPMTPDVVLATTE